MSNLIISSVQCPSCGGPNVTPAFICDDCCHNLSGKEIQSITMAAYKNGTAEMEKQEAIAAILFYRCHGPGCNRDAVPMDTRITGKDQVCKCHVCGHITKRRHIPGKATKVKIRLEYSKLAYQATRVEVNDDGQVIDVLHTEYKGDK